MNIALVIVDMQKEYVSEPGVAESMKKATAYIQATHDLFHHHHWPIAVVQDEDMPGRKEALGYAVIDDLQLKGATHHVSKVHSNSFYETTLERYLKDHQIKMVVIAGFNAAYCITATYFGAKERGFTTNLLKGGIASDDPKHISYAYDVRDCISYETLQFLTQCSSVKN